MASHTPDLQAVLEPLEKLERQNRRLKRAGLLALTAVGALLLMGQATPKSRTIEAEKFVLKDSAGKTRAVLSMILDEPGLAIYDEKGIKRADLFVTPNGPGLALYNEAGTLQTALTAYKGVNGLLSYNHDGTPSTVLGEEETGAALRLFDADGKPHIELSTTDQAPQMSFRDAAGKERAVMYLEPHSGSPSIAFYDQREKIMTALYAGDIGPTLRLNDPDENPRVELGVNKDGAPSLHMWDAKGKVTWSTPTENVASTTSTSGGQRPHVFIETWSIPRDSEADRERGPQLVRDTTQEMAIFALRCPRATVTIERQKADYLLRLHEDWYFDGQHDQRTYRSLVFDTEGSQIGTGAILSSLEESMDGACRTIPNPAAPSQ